MADDAANRGAPAPSVPDVDPIDQLQIAEPRLELSETGPELPSATGRRSAARRAAAVWLGMAAACVAIVVDGFFIARALSRGRPAAAEPEPRIAVDSEGETPSAEATPSVAGLAPPPAPAEGEGGDLEMDFEDDGGEGEPKPTKPEKPKHFGTVLDAALHSCSTASVDGLSRQIIEQSRCINPNAYVPLPSRPNLVLGEQVFPYLEASARDQLTRVLDARRDQKMTINSALRTVAQQYLVWRWSANRRCGVPLATPPGESNHESGLALDIAEQGTWRPVLEAHDFRWLGASDRVHFDFKGSGAPAQNNTDVLAFQQLWNKNHPDDVIAESGRYNPATEQRLKKAPADGFALGASCAKSRGARAPTPPSPARNSRPAR